MRKTFKHLAMAALASALIAGQATLLLHSKMTLTMVLVQENPLKYLYRHLGITVTVPSHLETILPQLPLQKSLPSQQTLPSLRPLRPRKLLQKQPQILLLQQKPLQKTLLPRFRPTRLSYRYSFFVPLTRYGVIRSVMTLFFLWVMQDF